MADYKWLRVELPPMWVLCVTPLRFCLPLFLLVCVVAPLYLHAATAQAAEIISGEVVAISDGDTLTVLTREKRQVKVRLAEIDTPEKRQPYGTAARQALSEKIFRQQVRVIVETVDRYGRTIGQVYLGPRHINREMVVEGHAWVYRRYLKDKSLLALEEKAKLGGLGLWGLSEARQMPPWEWRRQQRAGAGARQQAQQRPTVADTSCGSKLYCRQMQSCEEARFYLNKCGLTRLDGDSDGTPCEALCR
ncbi:MAG: thermonuclease family protein [Candidatus Porifericomitaceae bacterium WSBS_2022_MAG_OTU9]